MLWLAQLSPPLLVVLVIAFRFGVSADLPIWLVSNLLMLALPQLVLAVTAYQLGLSKVKTHGGLIGIHLLLIAVSIMVFRSKAPEAANGWLLYWFGSPVAVALGILVGSRIERRGSRAA